MSENCYLTLMLPNLIHSHNISVRSASGQNMCPIGLVICTFCLGKQTLSYNFTGYQNLVRPFKLGLDFL